MSDATESGSDGEFGEFADFDHERHLRRAIELAREAVDRGDRPFGSVLVRDDEVVMEASNRVVTENDLRRHPELDLAARAGREPAGERARTVMYTSTEPCPMCAGGLRQVGLGLVVYGVGADELREFTGGETPSVRAGDVLAGVTPVTGPVLNEPARAVHESFDWSATP